jgi:hypothetical protein
MAGTSPAMTKRERLFRGVAFSRTRRGYAFRFRGNDTTLKDPVLNDSRR